MNPYIGTLSWTIESAGRFGVVNMGLEWGGRFDRHASYWAVMNDRGAVITKPDGKSAHFHTHAEAIAYAQEQAQISALAARFTLPPNPIAAALKETPC